MGTLFWLDLTVNFVDDLLSVESLRDNRTLQELFLTGNPCTDYDGYRDYVIATLPQLLWLDGKEITKSERILAKQQLPDLRQRIAVQQKAYTDKRHIMEQKVKGHTELSRDSCEPCAEDDSQLDEPTPYTPESRIKMHQRIAEQRKDKGSKPSSDVKKAPRALEKDGKMLNINEGKYEFHLAEDDDSNQYVLEVGCPRFMDSSFIHCDVQPTYVRVTIKDKILQLVLQEEVSPDNSLAKRSQTTGKLLVTMPKSTGVIRKAKVQQEVQCSAQTFYVPSCELKVNQQSIKNENLKPNNPLKVHSTNPALVSTQYSEESAELDTDDLDVPPLI
eukprot:Em0015g1241a